MNTRQLTRWGLVLFFICAFAFMGFMAHAHRSDSAHPPLSGKARFETIHVSSKVPGRIGSIAVREGERVRKGDVLAVIEVPEIAARMEAAEGALKSASAKYRMALEGADEYERKQVRAQYEAARAQYDFAKNSYRRIASMNDGRLIAQQEYDRVKSSYLAARASLEAAGALLADIESGVRAEKIEMAEGDLLRAKGALQEAKSAYRERIVLAPADMRIESVTMKPGELAASGSPLFTGHPADSVRFRFTAAESDVHSFARGEAYVVRTAFTGLPVDVVLDEIIALPGYASVTSMYPRKKAGETAYELIFRPVDDMEPDAVFHDMRVFMDTPSNNSPNGPGA